MRVCTYARGRAANWSYFMSRCVIYASFAAFSPGGNEMVITTLCDSGTNRRRCRIAAVITPLMWEIVCAAVAGRKKSPSWPHRRDGFKRLKVT